MDPVSTFVLGHLGGKLIDHAAAGIRTHVIERWTKHRAMQFLQKFINELATLEQCDSSAGVCAILDEFLDNEQASETLFDAYRSVCLSRSKAIGPRLIGLLTARVVSARRKATWSEAKMLWAAETFFDDDLLDFSEFVRRQRKCALKGAKGVAIDREGSLRVRIDEMHIDTNDRRPRQLNVGPLDLSEVVGEWAPNFRLQGLLSEGITERHYDYEENSEACVDEPGSVREIIWTIHFSSTCVELADLIDNLKDAADSETPAC